ncbi:MAG TPA: cupin domain-containing protein [Gaiellaceae bacterium]
MRQIHIDEIETLPTLDGALNWKPIRHVLGIDAFGINAYHGEEEGDLVVEEHSDPHQELYIVVRGCARFRSDGNEFEARAGTFVLFEPKEPRIAHAVEPHTTVVAVGGEASRFEPLAWEYSFRAGGLARLGRLDDALAAIKEGIERFPGRPDLIYDLACIECLSGNPELALRHLEEAIAKEGTLAQRALIDEDFAAIRNDPRFESAIARQPDPGGSEA